MSKITLKWGTSTLDVPFIQTDALNSRYFLRQDTYSVDLYVRHSEQKRKAPSGASIMRHNVELKFTKFAVGEVPAIVTKMYFVIEAQDDMVLSTIAQLADTLGTLLADEPTVNKLVGLQSLAVTA